MKYSLEKRWPIKRKWYLVGAVRVSERVQVEPRTPCAQPRIAQHTHTRRVALCFFFFLGNSAVCVRRMKQKNTHKSMSFLWWWFVQAWTQIMSFVFFLFFALFRLLSTADLSDRHFDSVPFCSLHRQTRTDRNIAAKHDSVFFHRLNGV